MLFSIPPRYRKQVARILKWLSFSIWPLFLDEVAEIFDLDLENGVLLKPPEDRLFKPEQVLEYMRGLVSYDRTTKGLRSGGYTLETEIRFAHFSIKEYLTSTEITFSPAAEFFVAEMDAQLQIVDVCLGYTLIEVVPRDSYLRSFIHNDSTRDLTEAGTGKIMSKYELWGYALDFVLVHLNKVPYGFWTPSVTERFAKLRLSISEPLFLQAAAYQNHLKILEILLKYVHYAS